MKSFTTVNKCAVYASYVTSYETAKQKTAHTIEKLILLVMKKVVNIMIGKKESAKLNSLSMSNNTVMRRIENMSGDINRKHSPFYAIQQDESTDVACHPQLLVFICYMNNGEVLENLLFCKALALHYTGKIFLNALTHFLTNLQFLGKIAPGFVQMARWQIVVSTPEL